MGWDPRKPLQVTVTKPRVTYDAKKPLNIGQGRNEWNQIWNSWDKWGDKTEKWTQNQWQNISGKNAKEAAELAGREAERARRDNIVKSFGAMQQADGLAYASSMNGGGGSGGSSSNGPGLVGRNDAPGTIGANISSSGTF